MRRPSVGWLGFIVLMAMLAVTWPMHIVAYAQATQTGADLKPEAVAGKYQGTATTPNGDMPLTVELKVDKGTLVGTIDSGHGPVAVTGASITGVRVTLSIDMGGMAGTIAGTVNGDRIEGTWTMAEANGPFMLTKVTGDAARPAANAPAPAGAAAPSNAPASGDVLSGAWDGVTGNADMSVPFSMRLKLDGDKVTGDISSDQGGAQFLPGTWKDGALTVSFEFNGMGTVTMVGSIKEGKLVGSMDFAGQMQMSWAAVKKGT
jgi:hypothetical protein